MSEPTVPASDDPVRLVPDQTHHTRTRGAHTPGPWIVEPHSDEDEALYICAQYRQTADGARAIWIAECDLQDGDLETNAANARLIAKAPQLLDLLKRAVRYCPVEVQDEMYAVIEEVEGAAVSARDGGPAFPETDYYDEKLIGSTRGMSVRDYFAAHAPADYASWFAPTMPPRPEPLYDHDHPNERRCEREYECHAVNAEELRAYDDERHEQYEKQWPYAWADAMLTERVK